jgi:hypothetical protein
VHLEPLLIHGVTLPRRVAIGRLGLKTTRLLPAL